MNSKENHLGSIESKILLNIEKEMKLLETKEASSLILQWFQKKGVKNPIISNKIFTGDITFVASSAKSDYSGPGIMVFPKQNSKNNCYIGNFNKGKRDQKGWRLMRGFLYIGNYQMDAKHGKAIMVKKDNGEVIFRGSFHQDKMNGECYWEDPNHTYEGNINMQIYDGKCKVTYPSGDVFQGTMKNGSIEGQGILEYGCGDKYVGEFRKNLMNGKGTYHWKNGEKFDGIFVDGKMRGEGVMTSPIGVTAKGNFNDKKIQFNLM